MKKNRIITFLMILLYIVSAAMIAGIGFGFVIWFAVALFRINVWFGGAGSLLAIGLIGYTVWAAAAEWRKCR